MADHDAIQPDDASALFDSILAQPGSSCALAVSGGSDSTALMILFADWLRSTHQDRQPHVVLTVDHGLRPESAAEAEAVGARAAALGFRHATLAWRALKPATGIQAAARAARYTLMADYMQAHGHSLLLTGHTLDDQAETVLMRLARGSGIDGLAGIAPCVQWSDLGLGDASHEGLAVVRPLLGVPRSRLRATLKARGVPWIEDPSNANAEFERPRLRAARERLDALGLTSDKLALSAARLRRVRMAIERAVDSYCQAATGAVVVDPLGVVSLNRQCLRDTDSEIALRVLGRVVAACGGSPAPLSLAKLESIVALLRSDQFGRWTLARAIITATGSAVTIEREPGRDPPHVLALQPGELARWDGRFSVQFGAAGPWAMVEVRACGEETARGLLARHPLPTRAPLRAAALVPAFWASGHLVAVPSLEFWSTPDCRDVLSAWFAGSKTISERVQGSGA